MYLETYTNGRWESDFLGLYLIPETSEEAKAKNNETLELVRSIAEQRISDRKNETVRIRGRIAKETLFFDYYKDVCRRRFGTTLQDKWGDWEPCMKYLEQYVKNRWMTFGDVTAEWIQGFKKYLEHETREFTNGSPLSSNSIIVYFNNLCACIEQAVKDGVLEEYPM